VSVTVKFTLPTEVWGRLASIADNRGVRVADLLSEAVGRVAERDRVERSRECVSSAPVVGGKLAELLVELRLARAAGYRAPVRGRK
jgi:hypothetical protein